MTRRTEATPTEIELLSSIAATLADLLAVTALSYTAGKNQQAAIEGLASAGLSAKSISAVTGWSTTSVAPVISRMKAKPKGNKTPPARASAKAGRRN